VDARKNLGSLSCFGQSPVSCIGQTLWTDVKIGELTVRDWNMVSMDDLLSAPPASSSPPLSSARDGRFSRRRLPATLPADWSRDSTSFIGAFGLIACRLVNSQRSSGRVHVERRIDFQTLESGERAICRRVRRAPSGLSASPRTAAPPDLSASPRDCVARIGPSGLGSGLGSIVSTGLFGLFSPVDRWCEHGCDVRRTADRRLIVKN
jgi:hypothetical protein